MRSLIICEGIIDLYVLRRYLEKTESWNFIDRSTLPKYYGEFPDESGENPKFESYRQGNNYIDICAVGSDTRIDEGFAFLYQLNKTNPIFPIKQVFIVMDRDKRQIEDRLKKIVSDARKQKIQINKLLNGISNMLALNFGVETLQLNVIPIIIPFDDFGSLETLLLKSIEQQSKENRHVVKNAEDYVDFYTDTFPNKKKRQYLTKDGLIAKAKLSATISITHPDRTAVPFRNLVMAHNWEEYEPIRKHFKMLNELL